MSVGPIRLLIADDHPVFRHGLAALIETEAHLVLVAEAATGREALEQYRQTRPDIVLMDLQMPDMGGLDAIAAIRAEFPEARIVVLTTYKGDVQASRAFQAGAQGYLLKSMVRKELTDTLDAVMAGRQHMSAEVRQELAEHLPGDRLSNRESDVLSLVATGLSNKCVANRLGVSEETIKAHMKNILMKLDARDRTHAVAIGIKRGIIEI